MLSILIVWYLFLGGTGAGACFVLAALGLLSPRAHVAGTVARLSGEGARVAFAPSAPYRRLFGPAYAAALSILGLGVVFLLVDLEHVDRIVLLLTAPAPTYIVLGTYAIALCLLSSALLALAWAGALRLPVLLARALQILALASALTTMVYTGLLLGGLQAVPFWRTAWLPALFTASALSCGVAVVVASARLSGASRTFSLVMRRLAAVDGAAVVFEAVALAGAVLASLGGADVEALANPEAQALFQGAPSAYAAFLSARELVVGSCAPVFWGAVVLVGLAVPLVLDAAEVARRRSGPLAPLALSMCLLAGGFALRWCIVEAGMHPVLLIGGV